MRSSVVLPVPFSPSRPRRVPGASVKLEVAEQRAAAELLGDALHRDQALGAAVGGGEIDLRHAFDAARFQVGQLADEAAGLVDAGARFAGARLGAAAQPLHLAPHPVGQRFLAAGLRQQKLLLLLQEMAVAALHAEDAFGIDAADFGHVVDHVVQEVAVVAHHHAGEWATWRAAFRARGCLRDRGGWWARRETAGRAGWPARGRWPGAASSRRRAIRCATEPSLKPARPRVC